MKKISAWLICAALGTSISWAGPEEALKNESNLVVGESVGSQSVVFAAPDGTVQVLQGPGSATAAARSPVPQKSADAIAVPSPAAAPQPGPRPKLKSHEEAVLWGTVALSVASGLIGQFVPMVGVGILGSFAVGGAVGAAARYKATKPGVRGRLQGFAHGVRFAIDIPDKIGERAARKIHGWLHRKDAPSTPPEPASDSSEQLRLF